MVFSEGGDVETHSGWDSRKSLREYGTQGESVGVRCLNTFLNPTAAVPVVFRAPLDNPTCKGHLKKRRGLQTLICNALSLDPRHRAKKGA